MKVFKIIGSPIAIICMFLLIMISGEGFGGPYLLYILLGLPHGANYAVTAILGIIFLLIAHKVYRGEKKHLLKPLFIVFGILCLLWSFRYFFTNDRLRYNYNTFLNTVPIFTIIIFGICIGCALLVNILYILSLVKDNGSPPVNSLKHV